MLFAFIFSNFLLNLCGGRGGGGCHLDPSWHVFVVFSYLLNFCRQWYLCKFLILGDLSTHLFVWFSFPVPHFQENGIPPPSSVVLKWEFLKLCFLKSSLKMLLRLLYIYIYIYIYIYLRLHIHRYSLGNLVVYFQGENLNEFEKLCIFPQIYFMLKDRQKPDVGIHCKRTLISLFSSIH